VKRRPVPERNRELDRGGKRLAQWPSVAVARSAIAPFIYWNRLKVPCSSLLKQVTTKYKNPRLIQLRSRFLLENLSYKIVKTKLKSVLICSLLSAFSITAHASYDCGSGYIKSIAVYLAESGWGAARKKFVVTLDSGKSSRSNDDLSAAETRSMLAAAISAQSSSNRVFLSGYNCGDSEPVFSAIVVYTSGS